MEVILKTCSINFCRYKRGEVTELNKRSKGWVPVARVIQSTQGYWNGTLHVLSPLLSLVVVDMLFSFFMLKFSNELKFTSNLFLWKERGWWGDDSIKLRQEDIHLSERGRGKSSIVTEKLLVKIKNMIHDDSWSTLDVLHYTFSEVSLYIALFPQTRRNLGKKPISGEETWLTYYNPGNKKQLM